MLMLLVAALAPVAILMYYVYHKDINPEPKNLVFKGFLYGVLATFVSTLVSGPLLRMGYFTLQPETIREAIKVSFLGAAIPEELAKLLMLWLLLRRNPHFDERYDGIVYAVAVGLGFAAFENLQYVIASGADWMQVSFGRALLAVPGHFSFAVVMGYYYSRYHFYGKQSDKVKILLYPVLLHGFYDSIVFSSNLGGGLSGLFTAVLLVFCFWLFSSTRKRIRSEAADNDNYNLIMRDSAPYDDQPDEQ